MLEVFERYNEYREQKDKARKASRDRHTPRKMRVTENAVT